LLFAKQRPSHFLFAFNPFCLALWFVISTIHACIAAAHCSSGLPCLKQLVGLRRQLQNGTPKQNTKCLFAAALKTLNLFHQPNKLQYEKAPFRSPAGGCHPGQL
jgi:hypothetical protein